MVSLKKVLVGILLSSLMTASAQAMRWDENSRQSTNVEDRRGEYLPESKKALSQGIYVLQNAGRMSLGQISVALTDLNLMLNMYGPRLKKEGRNQLLQQMFVVTGSLTNLYVATKEQILNQTQEEQ